MLVGSGLFVASLARARAIDLGIEPDRVLTFSVLRTSTAAIADPEERDRERNRRLAFYPMVVERLRQRADIEAASLAIGTAFTGGFGEGIRVPGRDTIPALKGGGPYFTVASGDYFKTVRTRIIRGRAFTSGDHAGTAPVLIVNQTMASTLWPGEDALGKCFYVGDSTDCAEIVGVAENTRQFKLREDESMSFYIPLGQERNVSGTQLIVRPRGEASQTMAAVRAELIALDPSIVFVNATLLQDRVDPLLRPWRLGATMFSLMGILALVVAAFGLYSVMSYFVAHRRLEIGIRMALGARPADVAKLVVRGGLGLVIGGVLAGFALSLLATRLLEPLLFDTSPREPQIFVVVAAVLITVALLATVPPAARARGVNPVEAMRAE